MPLVLTRSLAGILLAVLTGCAGEEVLIYHVAPYTQPCMRITLGECLLVKNQPDDSWRALHEGIEEFKYEPGYTYVVEVTRREIANPPADGYPHEYRLLRVVEKKKE